MESRKIYKSGGSTYVMSLPINWVKNLEIKEGDSVFLTKNNESITLYPEDRKTEKEIEIDTKDITSLDSLIKLIIAYYLKGAETIHIYFKDKRDPEIREELRKILDNLVGIEIVEDIGEKVTLEVFIDYERMKIPSVLERIKNIVKSMLNDLEKGIKFETKEKIIESKDRENSVDKLYFLILRKLNYATSFQAIQENLGINEPNEILSYRTSFKSFERISDHIEDICIDYLDLLKSKNELKLSDKIVKSLNNLIEILEKTWAARTSGKLKEFNEIFDLIKEFEKSQDHLHGEIFKKSLSQETVIKYTDIMISLNRISQYISDMIEAEININTKRF